MKRKLLVSLFFALVATVVMSVGVIAYEGRENTVRFRLHDTEAEVLKIRNVVISESRDAFLQAEREINKVFALHEGADEPVLILMLGDSFKVSTSPTIDEHGYMTWEVFDHVIQCIESYQPNPCRNSNSQQVLHMKDNETK